MVDTKVSALTVATSVSDTDLLYGVVGGNSRAFTKSTLLSGTNRLIFLDAAGNDSNNGLTATSAKATIDGAVAALGNGGTLMVKRGSVFYHPDTFENATAENVVVTAFDFGPDPVFDSTVSMGTSGWTLDSGSVYTKTITHTETNSSGTAGAADITHFGVWEIWPDTKGSQNDTELTPVWDQGSIAANIAALLPGQFTCHYSGSTAADPRTDTGNVSQDVVYYVRTTNSANPASGATELRFAERYKWRVPATWEFQNVEFRRTASKDLVGTDDSTTDGNVIREIKLSDCAVHGWVGPHMAYGDCYATARSKPGYDDGSPETNGNGGGAAFHQFRNDAGGVLKHGVIEGRLHARGFSNAVYSHGDAGGDGQYTRLRYRYVEATDCYRAVYLGDHPPSNDPASFRPVIFDEIEAINCSSVGVLGDGDEIKKLRWIGPSGAVAVRGAIDAMGDFTVRNGTLIFRNDDGQERGLVRNLKASQISNPALFITATFVNCTNYRGGACVSSTNWENVDYVFEDSVAGDLLPSDYAATAPNSITTVGNNSLAYGRSTLTEINAAFAGVNLSTTLCPWVEQTAEITIGSSDLTYRNTTRTAGGTSGNSYVTLNLIGGAERFVVGQTIKIIDYDGAGGDFISHISAVGSPGANDLTLADTLDQTFSGKAVHNAFHDFNVWGEDMETTATISTDGTQVTLANEAGFSTGTWFHLGNIARRVDFGPRKVASLASNVATLDTEADWKIGNLTSLNALVTKPTFSISFGYPIADGSVNLSIVRAVGSDIDIDEAADSYARLTGTFWQWNGAESTTSGQIRYETGEIDAKIPVGIGDVVTWTANIFIEDLAPKWAAVPGLSGAALLADCRVADLGVGPLL